MKFAGSLLLFMLLLSNLLKAQDITKATSYPEQVGDITFNPKTDKANFELCDNGWTYQYYGTGTTYKGGTKALKSYLLTHYQYKPVYKNISGYITIRFVVSCKAQTDWFRVFQLDENYQKKNFDAGFINHLTTLCKSLNGWVAGNLNSNPVNTYYYINFKMLNGRIKGITP
jgi:hypothetical protein